MHVSYQHVCFTRASYVRYAIYHSNEISTVSVYRTENLWKNLERTFEIYSKFCFCTSGIFGEYAYNVFKCVTFTLLNVFINPDVDIWYKQCTKEICSRAMKLNISLYILKIVRKIGIGREIEYESNYPMISKWEFSCQHLN